MFDLIPYFVNGNILQIIQTTSLQYATGTYTYNTFDILIEALDEYGFQKTSYVLNNVIIDNIIPEIINDEVILTTSNTKRNNFARTGEIVTFTVDYDEPIRIINTSKIEFTITGVGTNDKQSRTISSSSLTVDNQANVYKLVGTYIVENGDNGVIGEIIIFDVEDISGNLFKEDGQQLTTNNMIVDTENFILDSESPPTIETTNNNPIYSTNGDILTFKISFNKNIVIANNTQIKFNIGNDQKSISSSLTNSVNANVLSGQYTITSQDNGSISNLNVFDIEDESGNLLSLTSELTYNQGTDINIDQIDLAINSIILNRTNVNRSGFSIDFQTTKEINLNIPLSLNFYLNNNDNNEIQLTNINVNLEDDFNNYSVDIDLSNTIFQNIQETDVIHKIQFVGSTYNDIYTNDGTDYSYELPVNVTFDFTPPQVTSSRVINNTQIEITFDEEIYTSDNNYLQSSDLNLFSLQNYTNFQNSTLTALSITNNKIVTIDLPPLIQDFLPEGNETFTLNFDNIYDSVGNLINTKSLVFTLIDKKPISASDISKLQFTNNLPGGTLEFIYDSNNNIFTTSSNNTITFFDDTNSDHSLNLNVIFNSSINAGYKLIPSLLLEDYVKIVFSSITPVESNLNQTGSYLTITKNIINDILLTSTPYIFYIEIDLIIKDENGNEMLITNSYDDSGFTDQYSNINSNYKYKLEKKLLFLKSDKQDISLDNHDSSLPNNLYNKYSSNRFTLNQVSFFFI